MATYDIENTPLWADIKDTVFSGKKPIRFEYRAMLHTVKEDLPILTVVAIDTVRDYHNNIGDILQVQFKFPLGDYMVRLYPYRTNLEFTLKRTQLEEVEAAKVPNSKIYTERYKAVFLIKENPVISAGSLETLDIETLNKSDIVDVKLQLLDRSLEPIRIKTTSGIYRNVTNKQVIHSVLGGESNKVMVDGKPAIDGLDIVNPDNSESRKHINIPTGTLITGLPTFLQEKMGGVYGSGIGTYLQTYNEKKLWFIYPLYNIERFNENVKKVIFYAVPNDKLQHIDRTYKEDASITRIAVTSTKKYTDSAETDNMNAGVGFRMADARAFMKKPVQMTLEGPKAVRTRLNHEVGQFDRKDGLNYSPVAEDGPSDNPFKEYTKILARNLARVDLVWENANPSLLYPGMPCKYVFNSKGKTIELKGVIVFMHALTAMQGHTFNDTTYRTNCQVTILTEKYHEEPEPPTIVPYGTF